MRRHCTSSPLEPYITNPIMHRTKYPTVHHFVTEMCTRVYISVTKWCTVRYGTGAIWYLWVWSIDAAGSSLVLWLLHFQHVKQHKNKNSKTSRAPLLPWIDSNPSISQARCSVWWNYLSIPNFNSCTVEVWESISNLIPYNILWLWLLLYVSLNVW